MKSEIQKVFEEFKEGKITGNDALERIKQIKQAGKDNKSSIILTRKFSYNEPYLQAHVIFGQQVLLGVTLCSLAIQAGDPGPGPSVNPYIHIRKFLFRQPVVVHPGETVEVSVESEVPRGDAWRGRLAFRCIYKNSSRIEGTGAYESASGEYVFGTESQPSPLDISSFSRRHDRVITGEEISAKKLLARPAELKTVKQVYIRGDEVFGEMELTGEAASSTYSYAVHPALLDGGFIISASRLPQEVLWPRHEQGMWVPFMIRDIYIFASLPQRCFCRGKTVKVNKNLLVVDYAIADETGRVLVEVKGFTFKYAGGSEFLNREFPGSQKEKNHNLMDTGYPAVEVRESGELEKEISRYLMDKLAVILGCSGEEIRKKKGKNFMDLGIDSNSLIVLSREIEKEINIELYPTLFFEYQNTAELLNYFIDEHKEAFSRYLQISPGPPPDNSNNGPRPSPIKSFCGGSRGAVFSKSAPLVAEGKDIAIIGMAGRFADSFTLEGFWKNLRDGRDLVTEIPLDRWDLQSWFDTNREAPNKTYCKHGSFIEVDKFDPMFFGISPREAVWMDPQLRVLLETVQAAIEDGGYGKRIFGTSTGVYVGVSFHDYWDEILRGHTPFIDYQMGSHFLSSLSGRISYIYDLQGESLPVENACASSLAAVHLACKPLRRGESEMAIAAGTNLILSPLHYVNFARVQALSPTGRCRTFDKDADGYVPGEGAAAILLKPLEQAVRDQDHIYAVIKGSAVNHVGKANNPTSPRPELQTKVLLSAWQDAGIPPDTISYIEAHGTGTIMGDPIEINALRKAFRQFPFKPGSCAIGSVKTNIGHLEGAAGMAGLIKTVLSMKHKQIPVMPVFKQLNPYIHLEDSPLYINTGLQEWQTRSGVPRRAGVSSFGMAGNNAHVVLEEYIPAGKDSSPPININASTPGIFLLSARKKERLKAYAGLMSEFLESNTHNLADLLYTLQVGREAMEERLGIVVSGIDDLKKKLNRYCRGEKDIPRLYRGNTAAGSAGIEALLEGEEGGEYVRRLIEKQNPDKLVRLWVSGLEIDWRLLYPGTAPSLVSLPTYPFKKERYWKPGSSFPGKDGIAASAPRLHAFIDTNESTLDRMCFKKVFTAEDLYLRDHVINGTMVLPGVVYLEMLHAAGTLANPGKRVKSLKNMVWLLPLTLDKGNDSPVLETFISLYPANLEDNGIEMVECEVCSPGESDRPTVHFQGRLVYENAPAGEPGEKPVPAVDAERIDIRAIKSRCPRENNGESYYRRAQEAGLQYGDSFKLMKKMYASETGGEALCFFELNRENPGGFQGVRLHPAMMEAALQVVMGMTDGNSPAADTPYLPFSLGEVEILNPLVSRCYSHAKEAGETSQSKSGDIKTFHISLADEQGQVLVKIKNFTLKALRYRGHAEKSPSSSIMYYRSVWKETPLLLAEPGENRQNSESILLFSEDEKIGKRLQKQGRRVVLVKPGNKYKVSRCPAWEDDRTGGGKEVEINPDNFEDYRELVKMLRQDGQPRGILHMWSMDNGRDFAVGGESSHPALQRGFYSLFYLSKALLELKPEEHFQLVYGYPDREEIKPYYAACGAFARTLSRENSRISCKTVELHPPGENWEHLEQLLAEFGNEPGKGGYPGVEVRYNQGKRFVRRLEQFTAKPGNHPLPWKNQGVYLITGGTGGLGLLVANYLARRVKAALVLADLPGLTPEKKKRLEELEQLGSRVLYLEADISQRSRVEALASEIKTRFGTVNGIIHAAGLIRDAYIVNKTREQVEAVLAPKVYGTLWLAEVFGNETLDFFLLFSSIAGVMGNPGQCDYAYANAFMDHFAGMRAPGDPGGKILAVDWPPWKDGGMQVPDEIAAAGKKISGIEPLDTAAGLEVLENSLKQEENRFMVIRGNPEKIRSFMTGETGKTTGRATAAPVNGDIDEPDLEKKIGRELVKTVSGILNIKEEDIDLEAETSEYGFDSITFTELTNQLNKTYNLGIMPSIFFEYRSLAEFVRGMLETHGDNFAAEHQPPLKPVPSPSFPGTAGTGREEVPVLLKKSRSGFRRSGYSSMDFPGADRWEKASKYREEPGREPIAITGMHGIMPGSGNPGVFWKHLEAGKDLVTEIPSQRWDWREWYGDPLKEPNKTNVKWGGFIHDVDKFDALFFGISPREAELMDPQQRIFMETVWKTIEDAGYRPSDLSGTKTGIFVGVSGLDYSELLRDRVKGMQTQLSTGNAHSVLANRISYLLDLHGPSEPIDTACSSSLVALHRAVESIRSGDCDMAAAGGVNVILTPTGHISFNKAGMLCRDGRCKTFDRQADGYVRGEGCGAVFLKPLHRAQADGDHIYAVITGTAINHGGHTTSLTAPSPNGQADVIAAAWRQAGIDPGTVSYIETHGTGTSLGDPVEINGLKKAFEQLYREWEKPAPAKPYCGIGSVKTNIGHLETAAGIAGVIKVLLAMKHKKIPPNIHFQALNPYIQLEGSGLYIVTGLQPWEPLKDDRNRRLPRRAGISSFGFGGVNAHVLLEEYENRETPHNPGEEQQPCIIVLSAKNENRLKAYAQDLVEFLDKHQAPVQGHMVREGLSPVVQNHLLKIVSSILSIDAHQVRADEDLAEYGFDAVKLAKLTRRIDEKYNTDTASTPGIFSTGTTVEALAQYLCTHYPGKLTAGSGENFPGPWPTDSSYKEPTDMGLRGREPDLIDMAYTLQLGREAMAERLAMVVSGTAALREKLKQFCREQPGKQDIYTGNTGKQKDGTLVEGEEGELYVRALIQKGKLDKVAQLWVSGVEIDWKQLYTDKNPRRISLPTYPFARIRHWISPPLTPGNKPVKTAPCLYIPVWEPETSPLDPGPPAGVVKAKETGKKAVLIIYPLAAPAIAKAISAFYTGDDISEIQLGARTRQLAPHRWEVDTRDPSALRQPIERLPRLQIIYFLGGIEVEENRTEADIMEQLAWRQQQGVYSLFRLIKALKGYEFNRHPLFLQVVGSDIHRVLPGEKPAPFSAALYGLARTIANEYPHISVNSVDISLQDFPGKLPGKSLRSLVGPLIVEPGEHRDKGRVYRETATRENRRYVRKIKPLHMHSISSSSPSPSMAPPPFRKHGVYLITGGAGRLGLELSLYLARTVQARMVLLGRSPLGKDRQEKITRVEAAGGKVEYIRADITDLKDMTRAVTRVKSMFKRIHGVIHAAVVMKNKSLENMDEELFAEGLAPKVKGTVVLHRVLKDEPLDFFLFFSSSQSFIGEGGMSNYTAGNCFMDAYAHYLSQQANYPVSTVNWGYWSIPGDDLNALHLKSAAARGFKPIYPAEGMELLQGILAHGLPQVIPIKAEPSLLEKMGTDIHRPLELYAPVPICIPAAVIEEDKPMMVGQRESAQWEQAHGEMERFIQCLVLDAFQRMGVFRKAGENYHKEELKRSLKIIPAYLRLYEVILGVLEKAGFIRLSAGGTRAAAAPDLDNPQLHRQIKTLEQKKKQLESDFPMIKPYVNLLWVCLQSYPPVLRGDIPASEVIFPGGATHLVEEVYKGNEEADRYNRLAGASVESYLRAAIPLLQEGQKIKILEIGAGTGGTSAHILSAVRKHAHKLLYLYTDISPGFVQQGKTSYGEENPFMRFQVLDIEKDVRTQGYQPGDIDILIASNVLHATRSIRDTLANAKVLLKRDGWFIINEVTCTRDFPALTFGLLPGWGLYEDEENRLPNSPLLDTNMWKRILYEEGFPEAVIRGLPGANGETGSQHVIIARSNGLVKVSAPGAAPVPPALKDREHEPETAAPTPPAPRISITRDPREYVKEKIQASLVHVLQMDKKELDLETPYSDFGVDSILAIEIINIINEEFAISLRSTELFNYPTIKKLTDHIVTRYGDNIAVSPGPAGDIEESGTPGHSLSKREQVIQPVVEHHKTTPREKEMNSLSGEIAIIGISGRFPGARDVDEFWENLAAGKNSVSEADRWDLETFYDPDPEKADKSYCKWGGFLSDIDKFDPLFFNISPKEAEMMDPQHRLFLEEAWKALEDAAYPAKNLEGKKCGVFVGFNGSDYLGMIRESGLIPDAYRMTGNYEAILSSRISYFLNLRGPAVTVNTACSSSLAAVHLACESIRAGTCEMALAGGVMVTTAPEFYIMLSRTDVLSASGRCRTFDNNADGIVPGEGVGAVLLKPLDAALADADHIYGVIIAAGTNQDGKTNGITAPSAPSQMELECEVYRSHRINPEDITYVETHGTGTRLGDPIEIHALTDAFRQFTAKKQYCPIGSVKTNIGHSLAAAGIAALIKVLLCLEHKQIPPVINFREENELIDFKDSPFYVNTQLQQWQPPGGIPRTAAISSFGFSGTNVHLVLRETPGGTRGLAPLSVEPPAKTPPYYLIPISAKTPTALQQKIKDMITWLEKKGNRHSLKDISYTLTAGRTHFSFRCCLLVENTCDAAQLKENLRQTREGEKLDNYSTNRQVDGSRGESRVEPAIQRQGEELIRELSGREFPGDEYKEKLLAVMELYIKGYDPDWRQLYRGENCQRISLPTYPFAGERYWIPETKPREKSLKYTGSDNDNEILTLMQNLEEGKITLAEANRLMEEKAWTRNTV